MRVLFLTNIISPYRVSFFRKLSAIEGIDLLVVHGFNRNETGRSSVEAKTALPFLTAQVKNIEVRFGLFIIRWQSGAFKIMHAYKPEVIFILGISGTLSNWVVGLWARLFKIKIIMWTCGWEAQSKDSLSYLLKKQLMSLYYQLPHKMLVYSTKAKNYLQGIRVRGNKITVCYNGIEIEKNLALESEIRNEANRLREEENVGVKTLFLYVGGMSREKRVDLLLDAYSRLNNKDDIMLWLVGDGPEIQFIKEKARHLNLSNIKFLGRIIEHVDKYFAAADFFVLPGIGGLALNQAMFWGVPCICSEADGTEDDLVFEYVTGFRFKANDVESLTDTMMRAIQTKRAGYKKKMGQKSKELITQRSNVDQMILAFHKAILYFK